MSKTLRVVSCARGRFSRVAGSERLTHRRAKGADIFLFQLLSLLRLGSSERSLIAQFWSQA